jgi:hypothetical protein
VHSRDHSLSVGHATTVNVSLFGRIIRMGKNAPFVRPGLPSVARYPLVLQSVETNEEGSHTHTHSDPTRVANAWQLAERRPLGTAAV